MLEYSKRLRRGFAEMNPARKQALRLWAMFPIAAAALLFVSSCGGDDDALPGASAVKPSYVVAGPGEETFTERYQVTIELPTPEAEFLETLKRLDLTFEVYGERGTERPVPPPRHSTLIDASKMRRVYQIYGGVDRVQRVGEMYRAYVDDKHDVVYIENNFSYTGP